MPNERLCAKRISASPICALHQSFNREQIKGCKTTTLVKENVMSLRLNSVRSLRQVMNDIEQAISVSAALSDAARRRRAALERGETARACAFDI